MKKQLLTALFAIWSINLYSQTPIEVASTWKLDIMTLPALPHDVVQNAFKAVVNSGIEFRYPQGGCQQRAEIMHAVLDHYSIPHARVFIFAPIDLEEGNDTKLEVPDPTGLSQNSTIAWPYHVAPCVSEIGADGKPVLMIIDPALSPKAPMTLKGWFEKMKHADISKYTIVRPDAYFFYTKGNSTVISGDFYRYEDLPDPSIMSAFDNAVLERELAINDVALFLKRKLDNGYKDSENEIRTLLSSVSSMVGFFSSQNNTLQVKGVTLRNLLEHHAVVMNEAMKYYTNRVTFWMNTYKNLRNEKPVQLQATKKSPREGR